MDTVIMRSQMLGVLQGRADHLAKRCARMGVPAPTVEVLRYFVKLDEYLNSVPCVEVAIHGEPPRLEGGWRIVASVQHLTAGNVVSVAPEFRDNPPVGLIDASASCDHCNTKRNRKMTVVLENENGQRFRVGTDCVRDFVGHSLPAYWDLLGEFHDLYNVESLRGSSSETQHNAFDVVRASMAVVRKCGWVKSQPDTDSRPTHSVVSEGLRNVHDCDKGGKPEHCATCLVVANEYDRDRANEAMAWIAGTTETEGYIANLRIAVLSEITDKTIPLVASLVVAYNNHTKHLEREAEREAEVKAPCVTGKITVTGSVVSHDFKENDYGVREVMTVKDDRGFCVWGTVPRSLSCDVRVGDRVQFSATVEQSDKDETFGFYSRPTKAVKL